MAIRNKINTSLEKSYKQEIYRKLVHLSSFWIPLMIYFTSPIFASSVFGLLFFGDIILEYGNYKKWSWARETFGYMFFRVLRNSERKRSKFSITGGAYVLLSAFLCTLLFSTSVAMVAISVMLVADTAAALVGKACGRRKIKKNKSLEGSTAFFVSSLIVFMGYEFIIPVTIASIIACFAATFVELFEKELKIDDNLSIAITVGFILTIIG